MAAPMDNSVEILLLHGTDKHQVTVTSNSDPTVEDLARIAENETGVPVLAQKLIIKGKSLKDPTMLLKDAGVKNGSKIMLIGRKVNPEDDPNMKILRQIQDTNKKMNLKLQEIVDDYSGITQGYIVGAMRAESLIKLSKKVSSYSEENTRVLEKLDSLSLSDRGPEVRSLRKSLVDHLNEMLDNCDKLQNQIEDLKSKEPT